MIMTKGSSGHGGSLKNFQSFMLGFLLVSLRVYVCLSFDVQTQEWFLGKGALA